MVNYKFVYFNIPGRGELIRLLFSIAKVPFENVELRRGTDDLKTYNKDGALPMQQLPILYVDDEAFCQSVPIAEFLAKRFGLVGKTELDEFRCNMIAHCFDDVTHDIHAIIHEQDKDKKAAAITKFINETFPKYLDNFENLLKSNNGGNGYMVGNALTWADVGLADILTWPQQFFDVKADLSTRPKLAVLQTKVEAIPEVSAWRCDHPIKYLFGKRQ